MRYRGHRNYRHDQPAAIGVLLTNLGSPAAPTPAAVRRYLAEFLWDERVVDLARPLWWAILHGIVLRTRPRRVARAYASIWTEAGAPLLAIARRQAAGLQQRLAARLQAPVRVELAMRYGQPGLDEALDRLAAANVQRLLVLPLYPQYSATTTATTFDALAARLRHRHWLPELRFVTHYHEDPGYLSALAGSVRGFQAEHGRPDRLLISFHGLPVRYFRAGDPYFCHCQATARRLAEALALAPDAWQLSFQSRFGREPWLQPYTDRTLAEWGRQGVGHVQVVCPGFSADCLETLEEIAQQNRDLFLRAGGHRFEYIPALNDRPAHLDALADLVQRRLADWDQAETEAQLAARRARARRLGADD